MVSVTLAAAGLVTVAPCIYGQQGCPEPTPGYVSIPFPTGVFPVGGAVYITAMFQDSSYTGSIEVAVAFVQNGAVVEGHPLGRGLSAEAGTLNLLTDDLAAPSTAGPTTLVVRLSYGGKVTYAAQNLTLQ